MMAKVSTQQGELKDCIEQSGVQHKFPPAIFEGDVWDLSHLEPFVFQLSIAKDGEPDWLVKVLVTCSAHCFTHKTEDDSRLEIPSSQLYVFNNEVRVLDLERYQLSREFLPRILAELSTKKIVIAGEGRNFMTYERHTAGGVEVYAVYFSVVKARRKGRLELYIESAYPRTLTKRVKEAKPVRLKTLLRAVYEGRKLRG